MLLFTCFSCLMGVDSAFTSPPSIPFSITRTGDASCAAEKESLCGLGFTLGLAPPTGTEAGLELADIVDVLRSRACRPWVSSSSPESSWSVGGDTGKVVTGVRWCSGWGVTWGGEVVPFPVGVRLNLDFGEGKDKRRDSGTVREIKERGEYNKVVYGWIKSSGHSLTLYSERSPVGGVCSQDVVDADGSVGVWRGHWGQLRWSVTQKHAGAHGHWGGDGGEVITSLFDKK